uniref:diphosphoinositol-polyphosphate diphosphatase n=1 Tax=Hemiselmis andersenii TaxID=464988 RepID=A0A6U5BGK4_HEMAN|mmetsp:Transcript_55162/g.133606  ORF Transcript_55162/g.133606 Transcript_55162/m.133606 type:complete len:278 (+) Transcript_55162:120-953(+)
MQGRREWKPPPKADLRDKVPLEEEEEEYRSEVEGGWGGHAKHHGDVSSPRRAGGRREEEDVHPHPMLEDEKELLFRKRQQMKQRNVKDVLLVDSFKGGVDTMLLDRDGGDELHPPKNFAMVYRGVYRSAYPTKKNFSFLQKLGLNSVVYLCQEDYSGQVMQFYNAMGVTVFEHGVSGNKEPFVDISDEMIKTALQRLLDVRNHPVLIHCNQGKHRTGSLVGCLRAMNHWSMTAIFDEYRRFAGSKARRADQQFIELFHRKCPKVKTDPKYHPAWFIG